jgi:hypothetical protein
VRKLGWLVLVLLCATLAGAQDLPRFDIPLPSKAQVLKMRYDGLVKWADKHAPSANEAQMDALADWYADIRTSADAAALSKHPSSAPISAAKPFRAHHPQMPDYIDDKKEYNQALAIEASSLEKARIAIAALPAGPRSILARYVINLSNEKWGEE